MISAEEYKELIEECRAEYKKFWLRKFGRHGYSEMEEDNKEEKWYETLPDDSRLGGFAVGESRIRKKLVFWKEKELDGVVVGEIERENEYRKKSYHTKFFTIGKAYNYFNKLYQNQKISPIRKFFRELAGNSLGTINEKIVIMEKEYDVMCILSDKKFRRLLDKQK
jgi:hypothetical protein